MSPRKAAHALLAFVLSLVDLRSYRKWVPIAGADVAGARTTTNINTDERLVDMAKQIALLEPDSSPLTVFSKRMKGKQQATGDVEFWWLEDQLKNRFDRVSGSQTSGDTSIEVANFGRFRAQDIVRVTRTGEVIRVTAATASPLTVVRGVGSTAAAMNDLDELMIIGSAAEEGDLSKTPKSQNPSRSRNYTEIFREPVSMTGTLMATSLRVTPHDWRYTQNKSGIEHAKDLEQSFLFGTPSEVDGVAAKIRTTGGAFYFVGTTNQTDAGGTLTESEFFNALRAPFRYGSKTKLGIASPLVVDVLNGFPRGKMELIQSDNDKTYGVNIMQYITTRGTLNMVEHVLFEGDIYGHDLLILDMDAVKYRYLANDQESRDTKLRENIQENDRDGRKDEYLSECGLQFGEPSRHGSIVNVTG